MPDSPPLVVAYQGEPGAFSEEALRRHFGSAATPLPCRSFEEAVRAVGQGAAAAVIPVANSGAGAVTAALDALAGAGVGLREVARVELPLRQMLLSVPGATFEALREVRSHPVALAQCRRFLDAHPHLRPLAVEDTAGAAREVAALGDPTLAALASIRAAEAHGLHIVRPDVHDDPDNRTTFVVVMEG